MPRRSKKHCLAFSMDAAPDLLLVGSGNPSYRDQAHATAHPTCPCHCLVTLATRSPGRGAPCPPQEKNATVMLGRALAALGAGDALLVTRLDRLARSTRDLLNVLDAVAKAGAGFRSLADSWADTTTPHGRLMLTVLAGLAEFERSLILSRTDEGRKRAQARGV